MSTQTRGGRGSDVIEMPPVTTEEPALKLIAICLSAVVLGGCAAQVTSAGPRTVIVDAGKPATSAANAQALADAECKKHGRYASMKGRPDYTSNDYVFDCVQ
jgi:hypothetical protein